MSGRKEAAVKNSTIGLLGQIISLILQIISRRYFIQFIGEEILGLNNTFSSILSTLSLAELGFQSAISYNLYRPLADKNTERINELVNVYKLVYNSIGVFFIVASFAMLPVLPFLTKNVEINRDVYLFFLIQAAASTCTYFLAYKRTVLYADQKEYVYKMVYLVMNIVFKSAQIFVIVRFHSYYVYITLQVVQEYVSNFIVHRVCCKKYPYLKKTKFSKECAKKVFADAKEIFAGRFAGYMYACTDNLIVSKVLGTVQVAFLGNYTTITNNMRLLINSIMSPLIPIVGNYLAENGSVEQQERKLRIYSHLRFLVALALAVPALVLIDDFIAMWVGTRFVLSASIKILLMADLYLYLIQGACNDYVIGMGLFKKDKYVTIIGVILNLSVSLLLVWKWGIAGILFGTVFSQIFNWIGHSFIVYKYSFSASRRQYVSYLLKNIYYIFCFGIIALVCLYLYSLIHLDSFIVKFILGGCLCEWVVGVLYLLLCCKITEMQELFGMLVPALKNKFRRKG